MNFHPHIHTIQLGGGLTPDNQWKDNGENFFLPSRSFPKCSAGNIWRTEKLWKEDKLVFHGTAEKFRNHYAFKGIAWMLLCTEVGSLLQKDIPWCPIRDQISRQIYPPHCGQQPSIIRMDEENVPFL